MSTVTLERIVELWPLLTPEARGELVTLAEVSAEPDSPLELTAEEEKLLAQARDDYRQGRVLDAKEYNAEMDVFMQRLAAQSGS